VSFTDLGDLVEKDAVMAGNLLHLVNSPLFVRWDAINSVRDAITVLGTTRLRNVVLGMSVAGMWNQSRLPAYWSMKRFNMHSAAVALLSDLLAQHVPVHYREGAFAAGLFHDLGRLLIAVALPQLNASIWSRFVAGGRTYLECEQATLGFSHADLSAAALAVWKLPQSVQVAVATHHGPWASDRGDSPAAIPVWDGPEIDRICLGRLVDAANQYVNSTGNSIAADPRAGASDPEVIASLGLGGAELDRLLAEFQEEYLTMVRFFS
jgi:HD-like signal output (HDOD) protein